jgi:hypothetical protein
MQILDFQRLKLVTVIIFTALFLFSVSSSVIAPGVVSENPEYEDVYVEIINIEDIDSLTGQTYHTEYTFEVIGNYDSKNMDESLSNGDKIKYCTDEQSPVNPSLYYDEVIEVEFLEKGDILQISFSMEDSNDIEVESMQEKRLPFTLQRYHNPAFFWLTIIAAVAIPVALFIVLIRLLKKRGRPDIVRGS